MTTFVMPQVIEPKGASDRTLKLLNSQSLGSTSTWDCSAGDYITGEVRHVSQVTLRFEKAATRIELLVEEGTEAGVPLVHHSHRVLLARHVELARLMRRLDPRAGDILSLFFYGRDDSRPPNTYRYRGGLERGDADSDGITDEF